MTRIGTGLLKETRASQEDSKSSIRKDVLSLLVQANTMQGIPKAQRMKDEDIIARAYKTCSKLAIFAQYALKRSPPSSSLVTKQQGTGPSVPLAILPWNLKY